MYGKKSHLIRCVTIGFDIHTFQVLRDCGYLVMGYVGRIEPCDYMIEVENGLEIDGCFVSEVPKEQLVFMPTYPAFSLGPVWDSDQPILWGNPLIHPTSFCSYDSLLGLGVIVGPGCLLPEGIQLNNGVRLMGGNCLRVNQKIPAFRCLRWGECC